MNGGPPYECGRLARNAEELGELADFRYKQEMASARSK